MNEFFTKLSGQIVGPMIFGTFFPILLFLVLLSQLVLPITPYGHRFSRLVSDPYHWQANGGVALAGTFIVLVLTVVLYHLNIPLIRLYEGYPWEKSWIGNGRRRHHARRFDLAMQMKNRTLNLARDARLEGVISQLRVGILKGLPDTCRHLIEKEYPHENELILPTRLGNVIRAFEIYSERRYKASSIALWPRIQGVMETSYSQALDNAKLAFDFMLNSSFLCAILTLLELVAGLWWRHPHYYGFFQTWPAVVLGCTLVSYLLYLGAINRAAEWGVGVKAAFDLYRLDLLKKLGYEIKPSDLIEERRIWDLISYHFAFPSDEVYPEVPYRVSEGTMVVEPVTILITAKRTAMLLDGGIVQVRVVVSNQDPAALNAASVILLESIAADKTYIKDSATVDGSQVVLLRLDPLSIAIGPLPYLQSRVVVYQLSKKASA